MISHFIASKHLLLILFLLPSFKHNIPGLYKVLLTNYCQSFHLVDEVSCTLLFVYVTVKHYRILHMINV